MKQVVKIIVLVLFSSIASVSMADQKQCWVLKDGMDAIKEALTKKCSKGDVLYYSNAGLYMDRSVQVAAMACDLAKTVVIKGKNEVEMTCIYNGITPQK